MHRMVVKERVTTKKIVKTVRFKVENNVNVCTYRDKFCICEIWGNAVC